MKRRMKRFEDDVFAEDISVNVNAGDNGTYNVTFGYNGAACTVEMPFELLGGNKYAVATLALWASFKPAYAHACAVLNLNPSCIVY